MDSGSCQWQHCFNGRRAKVDIQVIYNLGGATAYLSKKLGWESHIESALKRSKRNWTDKDDKDHKKQDIKLLGWYFAKRTIARLVRDVIHGRIEPEKFKAAIYGINTLIQIFKIEAPIKLNAQFAGA
jgi:hypothetical protein